LNTFHYDTKEKELLITGNLYTKQQLDLETKTYAFTGLNKENTFFFIKIDGTNEVASRDQKAIPITVIAPVVKAAGKPAPPPFYHIRIKELKKVSTTEYELYCNVYKSTPGSLLFLYEGGFTVDAGIDEMGIELKAGKIFNNVFPFTSLVNSDPKDINGKIELGSILEFDKFLYKQPIADVEKQFGKDDLKNSKWIIGKSDIKTGMNAFYFTFVGPKGIENKLLLQGSK
jgi:hypothetical protein